MILILEVFYPVPKSTETSFWRLNIKNFVHTKMKVETEDLELILEEKIMGPGYWFAKFVLGVVNINEPLKVFYVESDNPWIKEKLKEIKQSKQ